MFYAMRLWIKSAQDGEMDMPIKIAIIFAVTTSPIIGFLWLVHNFKRKN